MNNICNQCGKDKVADYPECGLIVDDLATTSDIKHNNMWKLVLDNTFQKTQKIRCEFMGWMIRQGFAKPDTAPDNEGLYIIPETIQLHPQAMTDMEQSLIRLARDTIYTNDNRPNGMLCHTFHDKVEEYTQRVKAFFDGQHNLLAGSAE